MLSFWCWPVSKTTLDTAAFAVRATLSVTEKVVLFSVACADVLERIAGERGEISVSLSGRDGHNRIGGVNGFGELMNLINFIIFTAWKKRQN